jgi:hypothetical protein
MKTFYQQSSSKNEMQHPMPGFFFLCFFFPPSKITIPDNIGPVKGSAMLTLELHRGEIMSIAKWSKGYMLVSPMG